MSKRRERGQGPQRAGGRGSAETGRAREAETGRAGEAARADRPGEGRGAATAASGWSLGVQLAFLVAVFAVVVLVAELAGAANLGVALGVGQIAFAIAVIYLLLRR
jgi:hypothetical protein